VKDYGGKGPGKSKRLSFHEKTERAISVEQPAGNQGVDGLA